MDAEFWLQRWREGRIGFHQDQVTPLLQQYWDALQLPTHSRVLVPLAGKSLDLEWFAQRGHRVLGVELVQSAVEQFFAEYAQIPAQRTSRYGIHYNAGLIEMICGDMFALDADALADCAAFYDRAALIALPPELRQSYAHSLALLQPGCRGLLITLEYPQREKTGPPFSVDEAEVNALFAPDWQVELLERRDILAEQPGFINDGVSRLTTAVYRLQRKG